MQAKFGDKVRVSYIGTIRSKAAVFDSNIDCDPAEFVIGSGIFLKDFENAVIGMEQGEKKKIMIPCANAYGPINNDLISTVSVTDLPAKMQPEEGMIMEISEDNEAPQTVQITKVTDDYIVFDGNHPLAGKDLEFEIELISIEK